MTPIEMHRFTVYSDEETANKHSNSAIGWLTDTLVDDEFFMLFPSKAQWRKQRRHKVLQVYVVNITSRRGIVLRPVLRE
jgi:hypothetical protein